MLAFSFCFFLLRFYEGGFMPKMTRREAALILGIRESSKEDRVKAALMGHDYP